jgi:hypothetical protein
MKRSKWQSVANQTGTERTKWHSINEITLRDDTDVCALCKRSYPPCYYWDDKAGGPVHIECHDRWLKGCEQNEKMPKV